MKYKIPKRTHSSYVVDLSLHGIMEYYSIRKAAEEMGCQPNALHKRVTRGTIYHEKINDRVFLPAWIVEAERVGWENTVGVRLHFNGQKTQIYWGHSRMREIVDIIDDTIGRNDYGFIGRQGYELCKIPPRFVRHRRYKQVTEVLVSANTLIDAILQDSGKRTLVVYDLGPVHQYDDINLELWQEIKGDFLRGWTIKAIERLMTN